MARWLREYFSVGKHKAASPPPPAQCSRRKAGGEPERAESELVRAHRLQRERDFEDPYSSGPGSSLRRLRALCQELPDDRRLAAGAPPLLYRSSSERRAGWAASARYSSLKHRLIKVQGSPGSGNPGCSKAQPAPDCKLQPAPDCKLQPAPDCKLQPVPNSQVQPAPDSIAKPEKVAIRDDYSDPFDAKNELKNKVTKKQEVENNGYMEPYEAQKMMAEIHKQESQKKGIQLYDTPYEPEGNGVASDTEGVASYPRESRLPQDDVRPAEEYDQPWEWNKVTIPTLAAQLNGIEKRQSSPLSDRRWQLRPPGLIKHAAPEFCGIVGERVDPNTPLEKQVWYHGAINRTDAENLLRLCKECSYLIRNSQSSKNDYSLSLKSSQGFMHMKLTRTKDKYILGQNSLPFDSIPEVIHYYTTRKLPIKGAEHLSLLYPVTVRTL